ncbi:MAG: hypothetical protein V4532_10525 [Pseudomonadota bacterium]
MTGLQKLAWIAGSVIAALAVALLIVQGPQRSASPSRSTPSESEGLPWQIGLLPNAGSTVFGLKLSPDPAVASTLADAQRLWASDFQMAVIAAPGEDGTLEAYVDSARVGFILGKLVFSADVSPALIKQFREHAGKTAFMDSTTRKYYLNPHDQRTALRSRVLAIAFVPQAHLDEATVQARFGEPAQRLRSNEHLEHWLYPDKGLSIALDSQGKELLQYVAPADFARLRDPLLKLKNH